MNENAKNMLKLPIIITGRKHMEQQTSGASFRSKSNDPGDYNVLGVLARGAAGMHRDSWQPLGEMSKDSGVGLDYTESAELGKGKFPGDKAMLVRNA